MHLDIYIVVAKAVAQGTIDEERQLLVKIQRLDSGARGV
jgi:hypothetical protein